MAFERVNLLFFMDHRGLSCLIASADDSDNEINFMRQLEKREARISLSMAINDDMMMRRYYSTT